MSDIEIDTQESLTSFDQNGVVQIVTGATQDVINEVRDEVLVAKESVDVSEANVVTLESQTEANAAAAASSASQSSGSQIAASVSEGNAENYKNLASASASSASQSESNAQGYSSSASGSADIALSSSNTAVTKASEASLSELNTTTKYNEYDVRELGSKAAAPTLDNQGQTLQIGSQYFNTTAQAKQIYTSGGWVTAYVSADDSGALLTANNLSDLNDLGTAKANLGISNVDNTSDANKPVSIATQEQLDLNNNLRALAPYSGSLQVAKKLDTFVFNESADFTYKVADKTRFVKMGDRVVDTYGDLFNESFSGDLSKWTVSNSNGEVAEIDNGRFHIKTGGDYVALDTASSITSSGYVVITFDLEIVSGTCRLTNYLNAGQVTDFTTSGLKEVAFQADGSGTLSFNRNGACDYYIDNISVKEIQTIDYSNDIPDVVEVITDGSNATSVAVSAGEHVVKDNPVISGVPAGSTNTSSTTVDLTDTSNFIVGDIIYIVGEDDSVYINGVTVIDVQPTYLHFSGGTFNRTSGNVYNVAKVSDTFRAIQDAPIGTALTDTAYFQDRDYVSNQVLSSHYYNTLTSSYEGIQTDIMFNDVDLEATLDIDFIMSNNGFSKVSDYLYSKGSYNVTPIGIWQTLNKGAYHPWLNPDGTRKWSRLTVPDSNSAYGWERADGRGSIATGVSDAFIFDLIHPDHIGSVSGIHSGTPDSKFYDIVYKDQFIDLRCWAKVLSPADKKLIADDKIENGVSEMVSMLGSSISGNIRTDSADRLAVLMSGQIIPTASGQHVSGSFTYSGISYNYSGYVSETDAGDEGFYLEAGYICSPTPPTVSWVAATNVSAVSTKPILSSGTSLSVDIISNPDNYPQVLKSRLASGKGVVGVNPLLVGQDGTDYVSQLGVSWNYILADKCLESTMDYVFTTNSGDTWQTAERTIDTIDNAHALLGTSAGVYIHPYTSANNSLVQCDPKQVTLVEPKAIASNSHSIYKGAKIGNQVSGKIATGNGSNGYESKVLENAEIANIDYDYKMSDYKDNLTQLLVLPGEVVFCDDDSVDSGAAGVGGIYYVCILERLAWSSGVGLEWGTYFQRISTTPQHSTLALDNSGTAKADGTSTASASKYFFVEEKDSNGNCLVGVYGEEMVWDYTVDGISEATSIDASTAQSYTSGVYYRLLNSDFGGDTIVYSNITTSFTANKATNIDGKLYDDDGNLLLTIWDGNGFGDDNEFSQLTNGTLTDLNGNTVRTFHGSIALNGKDI